MSASIVLKLRRLPFYFTRCPWFQFLFHQALFRTHSEPWGAFSDAHIWTFFTLVFTGCTTGSPIWNVILISFWSFLAVSLSFLKNFIRNFDVRICLLVCCLSCNASCCSTSLLFDLFSASLSIFSAHSISWSPIILPLLNWKAIITFASFWNRASRLVIITCPPAVTSTFIYSTHAKVHTNTSQLQISLVILMLALVVFCHFTVILGTILGVVS